ncbi:acyltransferase [Vibrio amylolyticus]|uniref:acyltransferase family protein n=1 Tax=Vibrio amylolyticus TaxID=2847292 RepID=UPI00354B2F8B
MYLQSINNLRGVAIILIVIRHLFQYGFQGNDVISLAIKSSIGGGTTILFVFVSGFMFYHVFYQSFNYRKFISNKIINLGGPYFILGTVAIVGLYASGGGYFDSTMEHEYYPAGGLFTTDDSTVTTFIKYYLSGRFLTAYWFIPYGILCFALAPIHIKFTHLKPSAQLGVIFCLSCVSMVVQRPVLGVNPLHSVVYFTPIYLLGIYICMHKEEVLINLHGKLRFLLVGILVLAFYHGYMGVEGAYSKPFFEFNGIDLLYLQKVMLVLCLYGALERWKFNNGLLNTISRTSFAIYFIHPWFMLMLSKFTSRYDISHLGLDYNLLLYFSVCGLVLSLSCCCALVTKWIFRGSKKTRYLLGY